MPSYRVASTAPVQHRRGAEDEPRTERRLVESRRAPHLHSRLNLRFVPSPLRRSCRHRALHPSGLRHRGLNDGCSRWDDAFDSAVDTAPPRHERDDAPSSPWLGAVPLSSAELDVWYRADGDGDGESVPSFKPRVSSARLAAGRRFKNKDVSRSDKSPRPRCLQGGGGLDWQNSTEVSCGHPLDFKTCAWPWVHGTFHIRSLQVSRPTALGSPPFGPRDLLRTTVTCTVSSLGRTNEI